MYYKNHLNSNKSNEPNNYVNKFLKNKNNFENEKFGPRHTTISNLNYTENQNYIASKERGESQPYKRVNKGPPLKVKAQSSVLVTESNTRMNTSYDNTLKDTRKFDVEDENELTFGKPMKKHQRNASMDNSIANYDKLICNNCLNTQLNIVKKLKNKDDDKTIAKAEENIKFVDNLNESRPKEIEQKLKIREDMTMLAAQRIQRGSLNEKESLQRSCENQEFPLLKGTNDSAKKRVMEKNQINESVKEKIADKFLNSIKSDKEKYYEKYVENDNVKSFMSSIGSTYKETSKQNYRRELLQQSKKKELLDEFQNNIERNKVLESVQYYKNKSELAEKERQDKERKMKQEFIDENNKLLEKKTRKKLVMKYMENQADKEFIINNINELERENKETIFKKSQMTNEIKTVLKAQINKKNDILRSQSQGPVDQTLSITNTHECKYPCAKCNKKYPLKMMNDKDTVFGKGKIY